MSKSYNQAWALWAITRASFAANLKNPQSLFFSLVFPLVFVFIFGSFGGGGLVRFNLALDDRCDTLNPAYTTIASLPYIRMVHYQDTALQRIDLEKGELTGIIRIEKKISREGTPLFTLHIKSTSASGQEMMQLMPILETVAGRLEKKYRGDKPDFLSIVPEIYNVRRFKQIDFVLPGQIGFSLLFSTLFGIAFTFFNLREQLVLKRFYATPVNRLNILFGIGFSRIFFQLVNVLVLISVGHFLLGFTLAHGGWTFVSMVLMSILFLLFLMGVGLIFSSIVKNDTLIPLAINVFSLPQMLLSGTFFPVTVFPQWIQRCCKLLPLTHFNMAMRKISFEGAAFPHYAEHVGVLALWTLLAYTIVWKVFRWE